MSDIDIDILTNSLTSLSITEDKKKGSECSKQGEIYEHIIHEILKKCTINNKKFNTQTEKQLGGSTDKNDIICHFERENDIGIEIKKMKTFEIIKQRIKVDGFRKGLYIGCLPGLLSVFLRNGAAMMVMIKAQKILTIFGFRD